jgi:hypothetical protein
MFCKAASSYVSGIPERIEASAGQTSDVFGNLFSLASPNATTWPEHFNNLKFNFGHRFLSFIVR